MANEADTSKSDKRHRKLTKSPQISCDTFLSTTIGATATVTTFSTTTTTTATGTNTNPGGSNASSASLFLSDKIFPTKCQLNNDENISVNSCNLNDIRLTDTTIFNMHGVPLTIKDQLQTQFRLQSHNLLTKKTVYQKQLEDRKTFTVLMASQLPSPASTMSTNQYHEYILQTNPDNSDSNMVQKRNSFYTPTPVTIPTCCLRSQMNQKQQQLQKMQQISKQQSPQPSQQISISTNTVKTTEVNFTPFFFHLFCTHSYGIICS